jgi:hypothetical protein
LDKLEEGKTGKIVAKVMVLYLMDEVFWFPLSSKMFFSDASTSISEGIMALKDDLLGIVRGLLTGIEAGVVERDLSSLIVETMVGPWTVSSSVPTEA